jgi:hypothetical protein
MYFDRFDIVAAHYCFAVENHSGQGSALYAKLCRISKYYKPSPLDRGFESLSENGKEIYLQLEAKAS